MILINGLEVIASDNSMSSNLTDILILYF